MTKPRVGECVYCGKTCSLTDDHIPPQCLCDKPRPSDLIKVPSCSSCNGGASPNDEYFRTYLALKDGAGDHPEATAIRPSVFRGLQMPKKLGFARAIVRSIRQVQVRSQAGLYLGRRQAFDVSLDRLNCVVARITKGLFWHHQGRRIPDGFEVAVLAEDRLRGFDAHEIEQFRQEFVTPISINVPYSVGRGVMRYWYALASDRPHVSAWIYEFYGDVRFAAFVMPAEGSQEMGKQ